MDSLKPFLDAMTGFGAAGPLIGVLSWMFWQERSERRDMTTKLLQITAESIEAEKDMTQALNLLSGKIAK